MITLHFRRFCNIYILLKLNKDISFYHYLKSYMFDRVKF